MAGMFRGPAGPAAKGTEICPTSVNGRPETPDEGNGGSARVTWWKLFKRKYRTTNSGARRGNATDVLIGMLIEENKPAACRCTWDTPMSSNHKIEALSFASAAGISGRDIIRPARLFETALKINPPRRPSMTHPTRIISHPAVGRFAAKKFRAIK